MPDGGGAAFLAPELVGREREFARLLGAWTEARRRGLVRVHVTGPPGIGKSRLLAEVRQRWRAVGVTALLVRCHPGSRRIPGVLLSDVVTALAHLPGSLGVSPACAASLVELAPALAETYRGAPRGDGGSATGALGADAERRWLQALEQLVRAVTEERPIALVLDDVHWADDVSSRVILGSLERLAACRVLLATTARDGTAAAWAPSDLDGERAVENAAEGVDAPAVHNVPLAPLGIADVDALVRSIGALPVAGWPEVLLPSLASSTRGVPLVLLELLALLVERELLALTDEGWRLGRASRPLESACALLEAHAGPGARVAGLDSSALRVLAALAVVGAPLDAETVGAGVGCDAGTAEARLVALARRGLVRLTDDGHWEPAHDEIRDAVLARLPDDEVRPMARSLGMHYAACAAAAGDAATPLARAAAAFVLAGADEPLARVFMRWLLLCRRQGDRRPDADLARELLGDAASAQRVNTLLAARPIADRFGLRSRRAAAGMLAAMLVVAVGVAAGQLVAVRAADAQARRARKPTRLALIAQPFTWKVGFPMTPVPIAEVQDASGEPVLTAGDSVRVDVTGAQAIVAGNTAPVVRGRGTFDRAVLAQLGAGQMSLRFTYPGVPPLVVPIVSGGTEYSVLSLTLVGASVNGQVLTPRQRVARVQAGDSIALVLDLRYTSPFPAANVVMGAAPSWGDPAKSFVRLASLVTPARAFALHTQTTLHAPNETGRYHVVVAFGAEENVAYLLSGTNWTVGRAIWHDGNDVADWNETQRDEADRSGSAPAIMLERRGGPIATGVAVPIRSRDMLRHRIRVPATTLTIDVLPRR
ncbi:AAA family ATPase [Gemmatirosa kalamazoonensis]|nr:AAA family ATPase [Gemmatirosa kalamazoonensis]